ncbi:MAG: DNA polymerase ligase N-terminal domain-containing protein [Gemmatimonadaceae bacterium]
MTAKTKRGAKTTSSAKTGRGATTATAQLTEYRRKRNFAKTAEPKGASPSPRRRALRFVIQKHAARNLHFDLRLELDGVMKSWAVPKGPSLDPANKRLAMQVEDHPIEYNTFEGIIPEGEYGGGTVMLWDRGTYTTPDNGPDATETLRRGYEKGDFKFELRGKRLKGSWVLVRMRRGDAGKPTWLLIKHRDEYARPGSDGHVSRVPPMKEGQLSGVTGATAAPSCQSTLLHRFPPGALRALSGWELGNSLFWRR